MFLIYDTEIPMMCYVCSIKDSGRLVLYVIYVPDVI